MRRRSRASSKLAKAQSRKAKTVKAARRSTSSVGAREEFRRDIRHCGAVIWVNRVGQITYRLRSAAKLLSKDESRPFFLTDINFKAERALYFEAADALLVVAG